MNSIEKLKSQYLQRVKKQLTRQGYSKDDSESVLTGLSEHIDEEIWIKEKQNQHIDDQALKDILSNLELPEGIKPEDSQPSSKDKRENSFQKTLAKISIALALLAFPLFYLTGYNNSDLAFDLLVLFTITALSFATVSYKTTIGRYALLACAIPLLVIIAILLFF